MGQTQSSVPANNDPTHVFVNPNAPPPELGQPETEMNHFDQLNPAPSVEQEQPSSLGSINRANELIRLESNRRHHLNPAQAAHIKALEQDLLTCARSNPSRSLDCRYQLNQFQDVLAQLQQEYLKYATRQV